jgi:hypothetical protein
MTAGRVEAVTVSLVGVTVTTIVADAVWVGMLLSLTDAVRVEVPLAAGTPEITPEDDRVSPVGRPPDAIDHL